jgi:phage terminase large subunit
LGHSIQPAKKGPDSILNGIQILQNYKINITRRSVNLKMELENYQWKKDLNGNSLNEPIGIDHSLDALRYVALNKLVNRNKPSFEFITI